MENKTKENTKKTIAIIAHDGKKAEMVAFLINNKEILQNYNIVCTGTTGKHAESAGYKVTKFKSGPLGGDVEIGNLIVKGEVHMVFFFRDPLGLHPHEPDVQMLVRICDIYNVPLATNLNSAELFAKGLSCEC